MYSQRNKVVSLVVPVLVVALFSVVSTSQTGLAGVSAATTTAAGTNDTATAFGLTVLATHGGGTETLHDSVTSGSLWLAADNTKSQALVETLGNGKVRVELSKPDGKYVRVLSDGAAVIVDPRGKSRRLLMNNTIAERALLNPAISLLSDLPRLDLKPTDRGPEIFADHPARRLSLSCDCNAADGDQDAIREMTKTDILIDSSSGLVAAIEYERAAENNPGLRKKIRLVYSDYRDVSGHKVPFDVRTFADGRLESELTIDSVSVNGGVAESDFTLPEVK